MSIAGVWAPFLLGQEDLQRQPRKTWGCVSLAPRVSAPYNLLTTAGENGKKGMIAGHMFEFVMDLRCE